MAEPKTEDENKSEVTKMNVDFVGPDEEITIENVTMWVNNLFINILLLSSYIYIVIFCF